MIRSARVDDCKQIGELWLEMVEFHRAFDPEMFRPNPAGASMYAQRIEQRLADSLTHVLVIEIERQIVAYAMGMIADITTDVFEPLRSGLLADIFVAADYRRLGWGKKLVERMMIWFRSQNVKHFEWHVSASNTAAIAFWRSFSATTTMLRMRAELAGDDE